MKRFKTLWNVINKYPLIGDSLLTLVLLVPMSVNIRALWILKPPSVPTFLAAALVGLMIIPLIWRRIFPSVVLSISTLAVVILQILNVPEGNFTVIITSLAIFSAAVYGGKKRNIVSKSEF